VLAAAAASSTVQLQGGVALLATFNALEHDRRHNSFLSFGHRPGCGK